MALAAVALMSVASTASAASPESGQAVFKKCAVCHTIEPNKHRIGPSLHGVIGRNFGSIPGFPFSKQMRTANKIWTAELLDQWLANPKSVVPGNRMTFPGLSDAKDREDVIEFLRQSAK